jgi:anti-anti-sigma regulatory factor
VEKSTVLVAREADLAYIQVNGRGSFQNAGHLKSFYSEVIKNGAQRFVIDLKNCTYLDSTFLGTMTGLGLKLKDSPQGGLQIINATTRNLELMQNLGLDRLFHIQVTGMDYKPEEMQELEKKPDSKINTGETMLEAHQNLMQWDERNIAKFKDVVDYLREDLGQSPAG